MFGISAALTTPLEPGGGADVDHARLNRHIAALTAAGCASVTLFGTTGEGPSFTPRARLETLGAVIAAGTAPDRLVLALHGTAVGDIVEQAQAALSLGVSRFLLPPPSYFAGPSDTGLGDWFAAILSRLADSPARFILYHIPQVIGVALPVTLVATLKAAFPGAVFGVKDSSGDFANTRALLGLEGLQILVGDERQLAAAAKLGAAGAISGMANLFPGRLARMLTTGTDDKAICALVDTVLNYPVTPAIKTLVAHRHDDPAWRRCAPPLEAIPHPGRRILTAALDAAAEARARPDRQAQDAQNARSGAGRAGP